MTRIWSYAVRSEVGLVRPLNEDSAFAGQRLIAVADGMGGHAAGEVASAATIASLTRLDERVKPGWDAVESMRRAVRSANATLRDIVAADTELQGMGTTVTAAMLDDDHLVLAHVGDSRAYLLRDGELRQLTRDHTYVQQLVDEGRIRRDEVSTHPQRNLITRSLDGREDLDIDVVREQVRAGDRILVCSDGLCGVVTDETMALALAAGTPEDAADSLIALALRAGGPDNITCVVADIAEVEEASGAPGETAGAADDETATARSTPPTGSAAIAVDDTVSTPRPSQPTSVPTPTPSRDVTPDADDPRRRSRSLRRRRSTLIAAGVLVLAVIAGLAGWTVVQAQYYVGVADGEIAIFQGVRGSVLGLDLSSVHTDTGVAVATLPEFAQEEAREGIHADGLDDARAIVERLRASSATAEIPTPLASDPASPSPLGSPL